MSTNIRNLHAPENRPDTLATPVCPTCDQPIADQQINLVRRRLEEQEKHHAQALDDLRLKEQAASDEKAAAKILQIETAAAERLKEVELTKQVEIFTARTEATAAAEAAQAAKLAETEDQRKTAIEELEKVKATQEEALTQARTEATAAAEAAEAVKLAETEDQRKTAIEELEKVKVDQEKTLTQRLTEQREALETAKDQAVNAAKAEAFTDKQKIEEQVAKLQRQILRQSADELGEGAEVNLYESLRSEFPQDTIKRVSKGEPGADVIHEIVEKGVICGTIIYDSKNRKAWRTLYVEKLRRDQLSAKADHAVLTTHAFPSGFKQIHVQDGVILVNPARTLAVAQLLRRQIVLMHSLRLSNVERDEKAIHMYKFITSEQFAHQMEQLETLTVDLLELDVKEKRAHDQVWNNRGTMMKSVQRVQGDISSEIDRIVGESAANIAATG
jgi:hypothetical protein